MCEQFTNCYLLSDITMNTDKKPLKETLEMMYYENKMSQRDIAKELDISRAMVHQLFEKLGIRSRPSGKAIKLKWKQKKGKV